MTARRTYAALAILAFAATGLLAATHEVGDGKTHTSLDDVPWESLAAGDTVLIHRRATPYKNKWVLCRQGTPESNIVVRGVADVDGNLPVIDGIDATTRTALNYWNEPRGIIKIGGANTPPDTMPKWIVVENLDIKSGRQPYTFTGRDGLTPYARNSAAIYIEKGENITIRNCILRDCGNGLFCGSGASNLVVEGCHIYDNGMTNRIYEHNNYTEAKRITFQFNHFGPLRTGCKGNNLKDRSGGCVIRYNWIESGNRQLDLVDSGHSNIYNAASYRTTFVYGNILIEDADSGNSQVCHYGGDSTNFTHYRKGTLHFYNNTVVSTRDDNTTLLRLSTSNETADCRNNIFYTTASGGHLAITANEGTVNLRNNWLKQGWKVCHGTPDGTVNNISGNISGADPGFVNTGAQQFGLLETSPCTNAATTLAAAALPANNITNEYMKHRSPRARYSDAGLDIGAYEFNPDTDYDGLADSWELNHVGNLTNMNASSDYDGDKFHDWKEYLAGTMPTNPASLLTIAEASSLGGNEVLLRWQGVTGKSYSILQSLTLAAPWTTNGTGIGGIEPLTARTVTVSGANCFWRIRLEQTDQ